jgi:hypothetical protein
MNISPPSSEKLNIDRTTTTIDAKYGDGIRKSLRSVWSHRIELFDVEQSNVYFEPLQYIQLVGTYNFKYI